MVVIKKLKARAAEKELQVPSGSHVETYPSHSTVSLAQKNNDNNIIGFHTVECDRQL